MENLDQLVQSANQAVEDAASIAELDQVRVDYLGKKGQITALLKSLGKLDAAERPAAGRVVQRRLFYVRTAAPPRSAAWTWSGGLYAGS